MQRFKKLDVRCCVLLQIKRKAHDSFFMLAYELLMIDENVPNFDRASLMFMWRWDRGSINAKCAAIWDCFATGISDCNSMHHRYSSLNPNPEEYVWFGYWVSHECEFSLVFVFDITTTTTRTVPYVQTLRHIAHRSAVIRQLISLERPIALGIAIIYAIVGSIETLAITCAFRFLE